MRPPISTVVLIAVAAAPAAAQPCDASDVFAPEVRYGTLLQNTQVVPADVNADSFPDLITTDVADWTVEVLLNNADGTFSSPTPFETGQTPARLVVADFNNDTIPDVITYGSGSLELSFLPGLGAGAFGPPQHFDAGPVLSALEIVAADFNQDGALDLALATSRNSVTVLTGAGDGTFSAPTDWPLGAPFPASVGIRVADLNADGDPDLIVAGASQHTLVTLLGSGGATFSAGIHVATTFAVQGVGVADLNNDAIPDAVTTGLFGTVGVHLGTGAGTFGPLTDFPTTLVGKSVQIADVNHDGAADVIVGADSVVNVAVLLGAGDGTLQTEVLLGVGARPFHTALADLDANGATDLVTSNIQSTDISVLLNVCPPAPGGCNDADLAPPFGTLDFSDVLAFLTAFGSSDPGADIAPPFGVWDFSDVLAFLSAFGAGCP